MQTFKELFEEWDKHQDEYRARLDLGSEFKEKLIEIEERLKLIEERAELTLI